MPGTVEYLKNALQVGGRSLFMTGTFVIGIGFLLGPIIVSRHFPRDESASNSKERVCGGKKIGYFIKSIF